VPGRLNTWLLLLVVVCALSVWFGKDLVQKIPSGSAGADLVAARTPEYDLPEEETPAHLVVLNGTTKPGLAREVGLLLGRAGCVAERVGNAPRRNFSHSLLINRRLTENRAQDLARRLGGIRVIREWDGRRGEDAVLVLGADHEKLVSRLESLRFRRGT
jgi:hypothetical protein